jgi:hypothetical protein|tara:strand:- start:1246 stop:1623 length:378 start_codon:yes stop_codon:yes gene_type:complete
MSDRTEGLYPQGEEETEALLKHTAEIKNAYLLEMLRRTVGNEHGRVVIWAILEEAGIYSLSFDPERDSNTNFREGRRSVGLALLSQLMTTNPVAYHDMQEEARARDDYFKSQAEGRVKDLVYSVT